MTQSARPAKKRCIRSVHGHVGPMPLHGSLAHKTFGERVHLDRLRKIYANYDHLESIYKKKSDTRCQNLENTDDNWQDYSIPHLLEAMLLRCEEQPDGTCLYPVQYCESRLRSQNNIPGGRLYAKNGVSLQTIPKWIRHTLCHDLYHDIDVVNAHPTLLLQLLERWGHANDFPTLYRVVHSRSDLFNEGKQHGFERDDVKLFIIQLMYGGSSKIPDAAWEPLPWLRALQKEFIHAANIMSRYHEFQDLLDVIYRTEHGTGDLHEDNVTHRMKFRLVSCVLQEIENHILHCCVSFLGEQEISVDEVVLCFDGLMVPQEQIMDVDQVWLEALSSWVQQKMTWKVAFALKQMDRQVDLSDLQVTRVLRSIESDVHACQVIKEVAGEEIAYRAEGQLYSKSPTTGKWQTGRDSFANNIQQYCRRIDLRLDGKKYSHNANGMRNIISVYEAQDDPNFPSRLGQGCRQKIFWNNGVYDFGMGTFRPVGPQDMTTVSVPREYPEQAPPQEKLDHVEKTLFFDTLGEEQGRALLKILARAVAGHTEDKRWFVILGDRNSGKGVIEKALRVALGPEYVSTYNIKAFRDTPHASDAEYELKWVYGLRWSRLAFSNESIGKGHKLDANLIKQVVSGGDPIRLRVPHGMPFSITPQCTLVNNANEMSEVSAKDALETCVVFHCKAKYVDKRTFTSVAEEERPPFWRQGDPSLKQSLETEEMGNIVWHLLLRYYSRDLPELPESIQTEADLMKQEDGQDIDSVIDSIFEITGEESDFLSSSDVDSAWKVLGQQFSLTKMRSKLKQFHDPARGRCVQTVSKRVNKIKCRGWVGLKLRESVNGDCL